MKIKLRMPKIFTLKEARETLPLVSSIVKDIILLDKEITEIEGNLPHCHPAEIQNILAQHTILIKRYREYQNELMSIGCQYINKDGTVGYYWDRGDGLIVELLWTYNKPDIIYWHEIGNNHLQSLAVR